MGFADMLFFSHLDINSYSSRDIRDTNSIGEVIVVIDGYSEIDTYVWNTLCSLIFIRHLIIS